MQGWFSHLPHFLPPPHLTPLWVGTHLNAASQAFLSFLLKRDFSYFHNQTLGCRDLYTLEFCEKVRINAYFSRCLTLTLEKRKESAAQKKIFLVGLSEEILNLLPKNMVENAEIINQQNVFLNSQDEPRQLAQKLLKRYENEAQLIITSALHCASPATAMGIPVVFVYHNEEHLTRFSALDAILPLYCVEDFRQKKVNFSPEAPNIEELKALMFHNLKLSLDVLLGKIIPQQELNETRQAIAHFLPR